MWPKEDAENLAILVDEQIDKTNHTLKEFKLNRLFDEEAVAYI